MNFNAFAGKSRWAGVHTPQVFFFFLFPPCTQAKGEGEGGGRGHGPKVVPLTITVHGCPGGRLFIAPVWTYLSAGGGRPGSISRLGSGGRGHAAEIWVGRRRGWGRGGGVRSGQETGQ